jgi:uncharacterized protein YlxW (UPF0749 family)
MKKAFSIMIVGIVAICIGFAISMQIASSKNTEQGGLVPVTRMISYQTDLQRLQDERDKAIEDLRTYEDRVAQIERDNTDGDTRLEGLRSDVDRYKMLAGELDVYGPGLLITLDDPPPMENMEYDQYSEVMTHFELLLGLVNRLKEAGAEAVSINGHRVVTLTEIVLAGDNVNINSKPTAPPYKVMAIGDPDTMESAITIKHGIISSIREFSIRVNIEKRDEITINRYTGATSFRYAKPVVLEQAIQPLETEGENPSDDR